MGGNKVKHVFTGKAGMAAGVRTAAGSSAAAQGVLLGRGGFGKPRSGVAMPHALPSRLPQPKENWETWARRGLVTQEHMVSWMICEAWVYLGK